MRSSLILFLVVLLFALGSFVSIRTLHRRQNVIVNSFTTCVSAGFSILESFPRRCNDSNGKTYTEEVSVLSRSVSNENVHLFFPVPGASIKGGIAFSGEARGSWYFEASFPVSLQTSSGTIIVANHAQAQGDWMTTNFVPFKGILSVPSTTPAGVYNLVLKNDNPSGDPTKDAFVVVPIIYSPK